MVPSAPGLQEPSSSTLRVNRFRSQHAWCRQSINAWTWSPSPTSRIMCPSRTQGHLLRYKYAPYVFPLYQARRPPKESASPTYLKLP
jgi:hypothetical protein